jgi:hypothetical protein
MYATANLIEQQAKNMETSEIKSPAISAKPKFLPTKYVHEKSPDFRTYHTNGAWMTVNASNEIQVNFFAEHPIIAGGVIHEVTENGFFTNNNKMLGLDDKEHSVVIRDFQCCVFLSISTAERLYKGLASFIEIAKKSEADMKARLEQNK